VGRSSLRDWVEKPGNATPDAREYIALPSDAAAQALNAVLSSLALVPTLWQGCLCTAFSARHGGDIVDRCVRLLCGCGKA